MTKTINGKGMINSAFLNNDKLYIYFEDDHQFVVFDVQMNHDRKTIKSLNDKVSNFKIDLSYIKQKIRIGNGKPIRICNDANSTVIRQLISHDEMLEIRLPMSLLQRGETVSLDKSYSRLIHINRMLGVFNQSAN